MRGLALGLSLLLVAPAAVAQPPQAPPQASSPPAASAADDDVPMEPPRRVSTLVVYGEDPCPRSTADEIIVCPREPESERYRVPRRFRGPIPGPASDAWANRVSTLETVSRAGLPNSCSPVGTGGQTGCFDKLVRQARAEDRERRRGAVDVP